MGSGSSVPLKAYDPAFFYCDYLVEIDTLLDIKQGWKITSPLTKSSANENANGYIMGVMGLDNNLKANFVNMFCNFKSVRMDFNQLDRSLGLKVRMTKKIISKKNKGVEPKTLVCLFSGSQDTPIYYNQNEKMVKSLNKKNELTQIAEKNDHIDAKTYEQLKLMLMNDKILTERFINEYILDTCECIVILIKDFRSREQIYVEDILKKYREKKRIIIIHHLLEESSISGVKEFIDLRLKSLFSVKEVFINPIQWFTRQEIKENIINKSLFVNDDFNDNISLINEDEKLRVCHLIVAKEGSPAGRSYNPMTFKYLETFIFDKLKNNTSFNLVETFKSFLNKKFYNYFQISKKPIENIKEMQVNLESKNNLLFLTTNIQQKIKLNYFETLYYNILEEPFPLETHDYLSYQVVEKESLFEVYVDIPFLEKNSLEVTINQQEPNLQYLIINGRKSKNAHKDLELNNVSIDLINEIITERGTAQFGPFQMKIPIASHNTRLKKKVKCSYSGGVLSVILLKSSKSFTKVNVNYIEKEIVSKGNLSGSEHINDKSFKNLMNKLDEEEEEKKSPEKNNSRFEQFHEEPQEKHYEEPPVKNHEEHQNFE